MAAVAGAPTGTGTGSKSDADIDASLVELAAKVTGSRHVLESRELEILELYDQLSEVVLERHLLEAEAEAEGHLNIGGAGGGDEEEVLREHQGQLAQAQLDTLSAKASHTLTQSIVLSVLQTAPVLKAVHAGPKASPLERALHPLIDQRDILSLIQANLAAELQGVQESLTMVQAENLKGLERNRGLTGVLMGLARELAPVDGEGLGGENVDWEVKAQIKQVRQESKEAKQTYRVMKSLAAGVVVGSGVDWAADEGLREMVLDAED